MVQEEQPLCSRENDQTKYFKLYSTVLFFALSSRGMVWYRKLRVKTPEILRHNKGPYALQGSTSLLPKLSVTSKVSAGTSHAWVGSLVHFLSSEDVTLLEFTSPIDRE